MARVDLKKVVKRFGKVEVVHGIDLEINDVEFVVLVGPSGCGKSTTLRMVAGLEEISDGDIYIDDQRVNDVAPKDRGVAMVFQNYALYPHMNVYNNMAFGLKLQKTPKPEIEERVQRAAGTLGLTEFLKRKPHELSGGQRQRVAMGRAIVRNPKVFLFDEPLSNLDAKLRTQMRIEIKLLHQKVQNTIIYVTHDQVEAMTLADRIVILKDGYIQQVGTPLEVFERPVNRFVARFIGNPPITILDGIIETNSNNAILRMGSLSLPVPGDSRLSNGQRVQVGIRPDSIKTGHNATTFPDEWKVEAEIIVSEILGGQSLLEFSVGGNTLVAELEGRVVLNPGETIELGFDLQRLLFFDPETGEALY